MKPRVSGTKTLVLAHKNLIVPEISPKRLEDDYIYELNWDGEIVWDWLASDHVDELGFSEMLEMPFIVQLNSMMTGKARTGSI